MATDNKKERCRQTIEILTDEALGQAPAAEALALAEGHLGACPECAKEAAEIKAALGLLSDVPGVSPSERFDADLAARLKAGVEAERGRRLVFVAALAALFSRVRRFELGAAVYPLVLMSVAYVIWAMATRQPGELRTSRYEGPEGAPILRYVSQRDPRDVLTAIEKAVSRKPAALRHDPFEADLPGPEELFAGVRHDLTEPGEALAAAVKAPATLEELERMPDPLAGAVLAPPAWELGGPGLALARFTAIKNSKPHVRLAISRGVVWLCRNQEGGGFWTAGGRSEYSNAEVTAASALALMESGFTASGKSETSTHLRSALTWLIRQKRADGTFAPPGPRQMHAQAMVCTALGEAFRLGGREPGGVRYRSLIQQAVETLIAGQSASGAWGRGDAELTALALMAAASARAAGLSVEAAPCKSAVVWLRSYRESFDTATYAALGPGAGASKSVAYATIGEVLATSETAWGTGEKTEQAAEELAKAPVIWESGDFFRWYAATLAAYRLDGRWWQDWRNSLLVQIIPRQAGSLQPSAPAEREHGSWEPHGLCRNGGRAYTTAMAVLSLTAACGHSPLYSGAK